ncbi:hypothetical protein EIP91_006413 [Steccherinum ochraceum]|uniref:Protein required for ethanol metabolism n=1 Tax=Steccherinum ochraceum TaxID=92696 RepID=A0A4R0RE29_9APHY|nr:hypothetical protein EIP91_006413 [Steccherinum ochraceum]
MSSASGAAAAAVASGKQTHPLLASYLSQLAVHPLRTKSITLATLQLLQEVLASHIAGVPARRLPKDAPLYQHALAKAKLDTKALKMAFYGFFVSAPLGHFLVGLLQKVFAGRTDVKAKLGQILASNLLVAPIQISVYLASMAIINGAKTKEDVIRTVKAGFMSVMRLTWMTSPLSLIFAQKYLSPELWVPFFNFVQFVLGTYFNAKMKKMKIDSEKNNKKQ